MISILLLFLKIVLSCAQTPDNASLQQQTQLPDGRICFFTCSKWIFKEKFELVAPSAILLGPGYLSKHKIGFPSEDSYSQIKGNAPMQYQKFWGAVYSIKKEEYDTVVKQSQIDHSLPFTSNEDVFVDKYNEMNCLVVDLGMQPGDHPPWRHFNIKIPNSIEDEAYYTRLAQIGVPQDYIKGLRNASVKPQYHPIIPQDYHSKHNYQKPKRTFDQLPAVQVHPNAHQVDNTPITKQTLEAHDQDIPELALQGNLSKTVQPTTHHFLPGVPNPNNPPQTLIDQPDYVRGVPMTNVQSDPRDVQVILSNDNDSGVEITPDDQPVVVITPMKISSTVQPVVAQPVDNVQGYSPVVNPKKSDDSSVMIPSKGPFLTNDEPKDLDNTTPAQVTDIAHPSTFNIINPSQMPDDQSYVVITPLKLPVNKAAPLVGQDYKVQTPLNVQPDNTQQTFVPNIIDNDVKKPKHVPPMPLSRPIVTKQVPDQDSFLTPDVIAPPKLQTQSPDLLYHPASQIGEGSESLPTSYDASCDNSLLLSDSALLTASPTSNIPSTYQNDSPMLTLNNTPDVVTNQPVQEVPHQLTPSTVNADSNVPHTVHPIPASFGVLKLDPILPKQPMFGFEQSYQPNDGSHVPVTSHSINSDILQTNSAPNHLQLHSTIPASFGVAKPVPGVTDEPMFTLDQLDYPSKSNPSYQIKPNALDHVDNSDISFTNSGSGPSSQLHPSGGQIVHQIPSTFNVSKPSPVLPDKPMFGYQSNPPSCAIPATYGITSPPLAVKDEPMFSLNNSPQPHATGLLSNQPENLVSQPDNIALTSSKPNQVDSFPVQLTSEPSYVAGNPAVLTTKSDKIPLTTVTPDTHTDQMPNQVVNKNQSVQLVSDPEIDTAGIPESATSLTESPVVNNVITQPINTVDPARTPKVFPQPVQQVPSPTYTPSTFMAPNYTPVSAVLGYSFAHRYPQYLYNSNYKPSECFYTSDELIPGFTFGSHIQLY